MPQPITSDARSVRRRQKGAIKTVGRGAGVLACEFGWRLATTSLLAPRRCENSQPRRLRYPVVTDRNNRTLFGSHQKTGMVGSQTVTENFGRKVMQTFPNPLPIPMTMMNKLEQELSIMTPVGEIVEFSGQGVSVSVRTLAKLDKHANSDL